ncbi:MAG: LPS-assembly protein LptD, partial [Prevotella sp.]|nr:LPS-assembly protein LptD [Prevotella sp.]
MRKKTLIFMLLFVVVFVMAEVPRMRFSDKERRNDSITADTVRQDSLPSDTAIRSSLQANMVMRDSLLADTIMRDSLQADTTMMDSLQQAIWLHNKQIDDSLRADSINRQRKNGIDAPVEYTASDSMVYEGDTKLAYLFGKAHVKYENMDLESDKIYMSMDSSLVHATGSRDTSGQKFGTPVFKMGSDTYENDTMAFNFKTKKGLIKDVYTEQDDGFMTSQISKRGANGEMYLYHGRYTTCDEPHPDFYFAMSRAKVRPGKDVVFGPTYLVVCDVPLPLAVPYGFFPFTKSYSSGFIMPTYGDETSRGFYLRDGGYYFAINDKMDLKLIGEIYTKGSWGLSAASNYRKRY